MKRILYLILFTGILAPIASAQRFSFEPTLQTVGAVVNAVTYFSQKIRGSTDNPDDYRSRANAYFNEGQYALAAEDYNVALGLYEHQGRNAEAAMCAYLRGLCRYILADYNGALADFSRAVSADPSLTEAYYFRGKVLHMHLSRGWDARQDFERALQVTPHTSISQAFSLHFLGRSREAESLMRGLLNRSRSDMRAYVNNSYNMAGLMALMNQDEQALFHLDNALRSGFSEKEWLRRDPNLDGLRNHRSFVEMMRRYNIGNGNPAPGPSPAPSPSPGPVTRSPANLRLLDVTFVDADGDNRISAGEKTELVFALRNYGPGDARGLELSAAELNLIPGLSFTPRQTLGDLATNKEMQIRLSLAASTSLNGSEARFRLTVMEQNGFDSRPVEITVPLRLIEPARLVVADHHFTSEAGGKARIGVPMNLRVAVQNTGRGTARGAVAAFQLPENVFSASELSVNLGDLAPGAHKVIDFEFFTNRRYEKTDIPIRLSVADLQGRFGETQTLRIAINQELEVGEHVVIRVKPNDPALPQPQPAPSPGPAPAPPVAELQLRSDVDLNVPKTRMSNPDAIAVIIGNRDYLNRDVPPVDYALHDVATVKMYLMNTLGYDENNIIVLRNATQADFNGMFGTSESHEARLFNLVRADKSDVFVYYSGHGAPDVEKNEGYFVPVDCDPSLVRFNGYSLKTFYDNLSKIPYRSITVAIDACFSGATEKGTLMPQTSLARIRTSSAGLFSDPRAVVLTAAAGDQVASWFPEQNHSLFSYYLLRGMQGAANADKDRKLTVAELKSYLNEQVPYQARRLKNRTQTPEVYGDDSKILIEY